MSNFMHKMKDAVTGRRHSMNKGSHEDSSKTEDPFNVDASNAPSMGDTMEGNIMGATTTGNTSLGSTAYDTNVGAKKNAGDNYGSTRAGMGDSGNYGTGGQFDSSKMATGMTDTNRGYGSSGAGMNPATDSSTRGYGSGDMNTGSRFNEPRMANEMRPSNVTNLEDRETYGGNMRSTTAPMGQAGNTMESGANNYNRGSLNMANQMENRAQEETGNLSGQPGFAGTAAGGSSYNAPKSTSQRRSSGPHNSNLLNKLDPRVHSSDYENVTANNQRGS
ncbi:hypothetical protein F1880_000442 [Penicillium rolfsii]|nr:hypothetical protein F1880_000442 [Penicillium rolfsii]